MCWCQRGSQIPSVFSIIYSSLFQYYPLIPTPSYRRGVEGHPESLQLLFCLQSRSQGFGVPFQLHWFSLMACTFDPTKGSSLSVSVDYHCRRGKCNARGPGRTAQGAKEGVPSLNFLTTYVTELLQFCLKPSTLVDFRLGEVKLRLAKYSP